jgi:hypothetical protein
MVKNYCNGITKDGHSCKKVVENLGDRCFIHTIKTKYICMGKNKNGSQCKRSVKTPGGKCHSHIIDKQLRQLFKRSSLQRSNFELKRQNEIQKKKFITQKRRMSLIRALRPRNRPYDMDNSVQQSDVERNERIDSDIIDSLLSNRQALQDTKHLSKYNDGKTHQIQYNPKSEFFPENIYHREENIHCGICLHESRKKGIRLSCCKFRQAICVECTRELLKENYKQTIDSHIEEYNLTDPQLLMRTAFTHCKCPFCRKKRSFKKFMKLLKKKIKNKK